MKHVDDFSGTIWVSICMQPTRTEYLAEGRLLVIVVLGFQIKVIYFEDNAAILNDFTEYTPYVDISTKDTWQWETTGKYRPFVNVLE
jgi:hypothetical protein